MNKLDYYEIGKRIRKCREELGLTQEAAAEQCGISPSFYSDRKKALEIKGFRLQGSIFSIWRYSPVQGLCRLFLFIGFFLFCLRVSRQINFSHKVKDNIYFLKTLAVYLLRRMDNDFFNKFINDSGR